MPDLVRVARTYECAADVATRPIRVFEIGWPTLQGTLAAVSSLRSSVGVHGGSSLLEEALNEAWPWYRQLTGTVTDPADGETERVYDAFRAVLSAAADSRHRLQIESLVAQLEQLWTEAHPGAAILENLIAEFDTPPPAIAAEAEEIAGIIAWLEAQELMAEVREPRELLYDEVRRPCLILLGSPMKHYLSPWCQRTSAARIGGWLLSAPPADSVAVLRWPGHAPLDLAAARLLPSSSPPDVITIERSGPEPSSPIWLAPAPPRPSYAASDLASGDSNPVDAYVFVLADGSIVPFASKFGPRPRVLTASGGTVGIVEVEPSRLAGGMTIVCPPDRSANDQVLAERAHQRVRDLHGEGVLQRAIDARAALKARALGWLGREAWLTDTLTAKLNDSVYARCLVRSLGDPGYIAPQKRGAYDHVRAALGMPEDEDGADDMALRVLRAAFRASGHEILREVSESLRSSSAWRTELERTGIASFDPGDGLGVWKIWTICDSEPTTKKTARSRLGVVVTPRTARKSPLWM